MPEAPEIPEAKDPFERLVAISIAIMAVVLSIIANHGDAAKTDAIIKTTEASNRWAYFQAKSVKDHIERAEVELLSTLNSVASDPARREAVAAKGKAESQRLEQEKTQIKGEAESLQREAMQALKINDRCDLGTLLLQIGVVLASVAIVSRRRAFWWASLLVATAGAGVGVSAFLL